MQDFTLITSPEFIFCGRVDSGTHKSKTSDVASLICKILYDFNDFVTPELITNPAEYASSFSMSITSA